MLINYSYLNPWMLKPALQVTMTTTGELLVHCFVDMLKGLSSMVKYMHYIALSCAIIG